MGERNEVTWPQLRVQAHVTPGLRPLITSWRTVRVHRKAITSYVGNAGNFLSGLEWGGRKECDRQLGDMGVVGRQCSRLVKRFKSLRDFYYYHLHFRDEVTDSDKCCKLVLRHAR